MKTFHVYLRGEDRTEFTIEVQAANLDAARDEAEDRYPEASVLEVFDPDERARDIYERAQSDYDNDYYYDD